jgi:hypothetical protein
MTLTERINDALKDGPMSFYDLAHKVYPDRESHRHAVHGGPPGCYMTLSAALRRGGYTVWPQKDQHGRFLPGAGHLKVYPK